MFWRTIRRRFRFVRGRTPHENVHGGKIMTVKAILDEKGRDVATIAPDSTLQEAARMLGEKKIGALVVSDGKGAILGILSERDIVKRIANEGAKALDSAVSGAMTKKVERCNENHTVTEVMEMMTSGRFRHLPVETGGKLGGLVSIGDVVKRRIHDVEQEAAEIRSYIATA
jgi:CBS domain-containing protein